MIASIDKKLQLIKLFVLVVFLCFFAILCEGSRDGIAETARFEGICYIRLPGFRNYILQENISNPPEGSFITIKPSVESPIATQSVMLIGSYSMIMYPGAVLRINEKSSTPITGRFVISGRGEEPFILISRYFELQFFDGEVMIEVTPDNGTYIAMPKKGDAFVKDLYRNVYDLKSRNELYFPLFGESKLSKRLSSFWQDAPTAFSVIRRKESE